MPLKDKEAQKKYKKEWNEKNKERRREREKKRLQEKGDEIRARDRQRYQRDKEKRKQNVKNWRMKNSDYVASYAKAKYDMNKEEINQKRRQFRIENPEFVVRREAASRLKRDFGITLADYDAMFEDQEGTCAICKSPPGKKMLAVDHDHETGKVRGLLCDRCNRAIGLLHDSVEVLERAIEYLARYKEVASCCA